MSVGCEDYRRGRSPESVAALVRWVPVRLVEVSRGGCRLECSSRIESGISGQLSVVLQGLMRVDDVRVARCQQRAGAGAMYQVGAELLRTRRLGRRTVRMAVSRIISGERGIGHARDLNFGQPLPETGSDEAGPTPGSRAPPAEADDTS